MAVLQSTSVSIDLPGDLVEFHQLGKSLSNRSFSDSIVALRPLGDLTLEPIQIETCWADFFNPPPDSAIVKVLPKVAVNLATISGGEYDAYRLLLWLPEVERYAIWNSLDHSIRLFRKYTQWPDIVDDLSRGSLANAQGELHLKPDFESPIQIVSASHRRLTISSLLRLRRPRYRDIASLFVMAASLIGIGLMMLTSELPAISPETFDQIEIGMSEREVLRIVRASPGWYRTDASSPAYVDDNFYFRSLFRGWEGVRSLTITKGLSGTVSRSDIWGSNDGMLIVDYDKDGHVSKVDLNYPPGRQFSHPERWTWWKRLLGRQRRVGPPMYIGSM